MKSFRFKISVRTLIVLAILLLSAYLRLYRIADYLTFLGDEGRDVLIVKRMIVDGKWTLLGPTASVGGFYMGPIYYYFMLPFLWAWKLNPVGPAVMVALFGVITTYLVYMIGAKVFNRTAAYSASLLYALSPLVIAYSRSSWNPNIVPFFSTLALYLTFTVTEKNAWQRLFWIGVLFGIGIQLHYTFLFLVLPVGLWLLFYGHTREYIRYYALGIAGFLTGFSPFLLFELRHDFTNTKGIMSFVFSSEGSGFSWSALQKNVVSVFFRMYSRLILRIPDGGMYTSLTPVVRTVWTWGSWLLAGAVSVIAVISARNGTNAGSRMLRLMLLWIICSLGFFGIYPKSIYDYYFGIFFTIPFFLTGYALSKIVDNGRIGKFIGIIFIAGLAFFNWQGRPFKFEPNRQLAQVRLISSFVLEKAGGKPFNFALITGGNSDHGYRYFFEIWNRSPVTIENSSVDPDRTSVTEQLLVVCEDVSCQPLGNSLWEVAGFGRAEIAGVWDVSVVKVFKLVHYVDKGSQ